jgi:amino acid transporter
LPLFVVETGFKQLWAALLRGLLFSLIGLALIFGWVVRNHQVAGISSLSSTAESVLVYYSAPAVLEIAEDVDKKTATSRINAMIQARIPSGNLPPAEIAELERQVAFDIFRQYPVSTLKVYLGGILQFLVNPGLDNICALLSRASDVKGCVATRSILRPSFVERVQGKFGGMDGTQLVIAVWSMLFLLTLYVLSAVGAYALIRRNQWFELLSLGIIIVYLIVLSAGGQTTSRFRVPTMPYWAVLAGVGWGLIVERFAMRRGAGSQIETQGIQSA